ncbi:MAG: ABC transporter, partial [Actinomycetota bacterium]
MAEFDFRSLPAIWTRELIIFKRYWQGTTFTAVLEPLIFLFAIGLGVGAFVDEIDGMEYVVFVGTGAVATAVLFSSVFPGMYNTFIARVFQKVYD